MRDDMRGELFRELGNWDRERGKQPKTRAGRCQESFQDGCIPPEPDAIGRRIAVLLKGGEWSRAFVALEMAYAEANEVDGSDESLGGLGIDARSRNLLEARGLRTVSDLAARTDDELLQLAGVGPEIVRRVRAAVALRRRTTAA